MIEQVSVFAENRRGAMYDMTRLLAEENVNIESHITNDSAEFGIVRMIVSDPHKAKEKLESVGYLVRLDKVLAVYIGDESGSLCKLLGEIADSYVNMDYLYVSYDRETGSPIAIIKCESAYEVQESLTAKGYRFR